MQQRQLRLGDILDDYCPRERRVTNHAVVAMVGEDVKQTRCTTCDTEHEYKHARIPRQRKKGDTPAALYAQVAAAAPKRVAHEPAVADSDVASAANEAIDEPVETTESPVAAAPVAPGPEAEGDADADDVDAEDANGNTDPQDDGPIHRRLIRASLPRPEGQQPPARPIPEFTIRQPGGRQNRFRPRHQRGGGPQGQQFFGNRSNGNNSMRGPRPNSGRPGGGMMNRRGQGGGGRKRSK